MDIKIHIWKRQTSGRISDRIKFKCPHCQLVILPTPRFFIMMNVHGFAYLPSKGKGKCQGCTKEVDLPPFFENMGELLRFKGRVQDIMRRERDASSIVLLDPAQACNVPPKLAIPSFFN